MKKLLLLVLAISFFSCEKSDSNSGAVGFLGEKEWSKTFGGSNEDHLHGITPTADGGFLTIGYTKSNDGDIVQKISTEEDIWLTKFNAAGEIIWSKTYGGSMDDYGYSVHENPDATLVIASYSKSSDVDVPSNLGMHDFFIFKTDAQGNIIWKKSYGFSSHDHAHKVISTSDGGYFIAGFIDYSGIGKSMATLHGVGEFYGLKLDSEGNKLWDRYFGGTQNDRIFDVVEADDTGLVMVGYSESNDFDADDNHGSYDFWVVKVSNSGTLVWKKSYGGSGIDQPYGIAKTMNNSYLVAGISNSNDGDVSENLGQNDVWVIHITDNGSLLWEKSFGGSGFDAATSLKRMRNGNYLISGHSRSTDGLFSENKGENDLFALIINESGQVQWQKTFGGSAIDLGVDAAALNDNSIMIVGETTSDDFDVPNNKGMTDILLVKVK
jgi:hypothetical protein